MEHNEEVSPEKEWNDNYSVRTIPPFQIIIQTGYKLYSILMGGVHRRFNVAIHLTYSLHVAEFFLRR